MKPILAGMFVILGLSAALPLFFFGFFMTPENSVGFSRIYNWYDMIYWIIGAVFYIVGALLFATRIPEKFYPKRFDIVGQSHQIFHIMIVIAAFSHFKGSYLLYIDRINSVCDIVDT